MTADFDFGLGLSSISARRCALFDTEVNVAHTIVDNWTMPLIHADIPNNAHNAQSLRMGGRKVEKKEPIW
jgi:hypothetical protein